MSDCEDMRNCLSCLERELHGLQKLRWEKRAEATVEESFVCQSNELDLILGSVGFATGFSLEEGHHFFLNHSISLFPFKLKVTKS